MIYKLKAVIVLCLVTFVLSGCAHLVSDEDAATGYADRGIRLIALAPVDNKTGDAQAAAILRENLLDALYSKGYPRIPINIVDDKLAAEYSRSEKEPKDDAALGVLGKTLGVDAVMFSSLLKWETSYVGIYAVSRVSVSLELKDAKTGKSLWSSVQRVTDRHYNITRKRLELEACQSYEPAILEIIEKAFGSFPNGPDFVGKASPEEGFWKIW